MKNWTSDDGKIELRCGRWQDVLADVEACDAVITDPPYSERTHSGQHHTRNGIAYEPITGDDIEQLTTMIAERCDGWAVVHSDDATALAYRAEIESLGRLALPIVPVLQQMPRLSGDGPGSSGHFLVVSRPRSKRFMGWGSLPGWYHAQRDKTGIVRGAKPLCLMRAIVRDYSKPGDLIVDPYAGGGTTLLASAIEGRRAIGAELDPKTWALAVKRLRAGYTIEMF